MNNYYRSVSIAYRANRKPFRERLIAWARKDDVRFCAASLLTGAAFGLILVETYFQ